MLEIVLGYTIINRRLIVTLLITITAKQAHGKGGGGHHYCFTPFPSPPTHPNTPLL